jgi:ABC-type antimicrobial peptide transport system permease subunit
VAERTAANIATLSSGAAILIVAAGLYAVVAFAVMQRRREIGIRMALGAQPLRIAASMFSRAALLGGIGAATGLLSATLLGPQMKSLLYGVTPSDPRVLTVAAALALLVTIIATLVPALRAARLDPASVLREE